MDNNEHTILSYRYFEGTRQYIYACDICKKPTMKGRAVTRGLALCDDCKKEKFRKYNRERTKVKKCYYKDVPYEEIDQGKVGALYKAKRSIQWIADDMNTNTEIITRILRENNFNV